MADVRYTQEQLEVLNAEGKIIVSASAGSGKTFVMIERMLRKILSGAEVERMLALTFTKKAAAQMREKIQKSIIAKLNAPEITQQERDMLKRQLNRLPMAQISTIHSFCANFIRSHFFLTDVDGSFDILSEDDADGKSLQFLAMEQVFSEAYEQADEGFLRLLSIYYRKKKDNKLKEIILSLYKSLRVRADYREVLLQTKSGDATLFHRVTEELFCRVKAECDYILQAVSQYLPELKSLGNKTTLELILQMMEFIQTVKSQADYFQFCALPMPAFKRKETVRSAERLREKEIIERVAFYKTALTNICKDHLTNTEDFYATQKRRFACAQDTAGLLAEFILRFDERYTALKKERAKLDYNDLEHVALQLLSIEGVAAEMSEKFDYVFVDEYQDINPVQEKIISFVSGKNVFLVGDVKQSIYAFRGSKSVYFTQKQSEFSLQGQSLFLTSNFRSSDGILNAVNRVFCRAMTSKLCGIPYADKPMQGGTGYAGNAGRVRVHLVSEEKSEPKERGVYSVLEEYAAAKTRIRQNVQAQEILNVIEEELHSQYYDLEEQTFKPVTYGDIAVLSRKKSGDVSEIVAYLCENGIPVSSATKVNVCAFPEIRQLTDILSLIDNREQDVPLCSALLSAMGGLDNAELAAVRLRYERRKIPFRECVKLYKEQFADPLAQKIKKFFTLLEKYVALSHVLSAGELIERLIAEAGLETDWLSREDGTRRLVRIRNFALQAQDKNVHDFLERLKSLDYEVFLSENAGENAVKVLTMHASKGLEYPIVILVDLNTPFHGADRSEVYLSENYGIAPKCYDGEKKLVYDTLLRKLIGMEEREEELKSELNLLYVAMTRAKYGLHLIMDSKDAQKYSDPFYAEKYAHLLPLSLFEGEIAPPYAQVLPFEKRQTIIVGGNEALTKQLIRHFRAPYPYALNTSLPVKSSASDILDSQESEPEYYAVHRLVPEEEQEQRVEKTLIGTAYHAFLEHAEFSVGAKEELARMSEKSLLSEEQLALISPEKAQEILSMSVFRRLQGATLYREQPFLVLLPAKHIFKTSSEEEVLFQGFIDLQAITERGVE
ncbi:MAG: UvrD-helicase domain-containing protein, partial [Clostridia bacterium]|nr:UvrD-helicase domain-containing protein [Clostridia bacterium]